MSCETTQGSGYACEACGGKGWYAWGYTDAPQQVRCDACLGTGELPSVPGGNENQPAPTVSPK